MKGKIMYEASSKQKSYGKLLEKKLKMKSSSRAWNQMTIQQASERIEDLKLMIKLGIDPTAINWKSEAAKAIREHQKNAGKVLAGKTYRAGA